MKSLNAVQLRVFCKPDEEDQDKIRQALTEFVPFNLEEEKIEIAKRRAMGFQDKPITVFTIELTKARHTNAFLKFLLKTLTDEQREMLLRQRQSRIDNDLCFFIRFDKESWLDKRELRITDSGNCFHVKLSLAVFPAKKELALALVEKIFKAE